MKVDGDDKMIRCWLREHRGVVDYFFAGVFAVALLAFTMIPEESPASWVALGAMGVAAVFRAVIAVARI